MRWWILYEEKKKKNNRREDYETKLYNLKRYIHSQVYIYPMSESLQLMELIYKHE